jgi:hypothetical protein
LLKTAGSGVFASTTVTAREPFTVEAGYEDDSDKDKGKNEDKR